jgi:hypothetical protein
MQQRNNQGWCEKMVLQGKIVSRRHIIDRQLFLLWALQPNIVLFVFFFCFSIIKKTVPNPEEAEK